jgi:hypothetical protein
LNERSVSSCSSCDSASVMGMPGEVIGYGSLVGQIGPPGVDCRARGRAGQAGRAGKVRLTRSPGTIDTAAGAG